MLLHAVQHPRVPSLPFLFVHCQQIDPIISYLILHCTVPLLSPITAHHVPVTDSMGITVCLSLSRLSGVSSRPPRPSDVRTPEQNCLTGNRQDVRIRSGERLEKRTKEKGREREREREGESQRDIITIAKRLGLSFHTLHHVHEACISLLAQAQC